jgi:hypothetical protein
VFAQGIGAFFGVIKETGDAHEVFEFVEASAFGFDD